MKRLNQTIGLIGSGNMGSAILAGLLRRRIARPGQIWIYDSVSSKAKSTAKRFGVRAAKSNLDLARRTNIILLAIKPQDLKTVAGEIRFALRSNQTVVSILAGTPVSKLKRLLKKATVVRAMPNLGAQVGESVTAVTSSSPRGLSIAETIFSGCGEVIRLSEKHFDLVTAVSGSGPAYFFLIMEILTQAARKGGISAKAARLLAVQTALGAAKLAQDSSDSPETLRKKVTSKKGTTEVALKFLFKKGFHKTFSEAIRRAVLRARELSRI